MKYHQIDQTFVDSSVVLDITYKNKTFNVQNSERSLQKRNLCSQ